MYAFQNIITNNTIKRKLILQKNKNNKLHKENASDHRY